MSAKSKTKKKSTKKEQVAPEPITQPDPKPVIDPNRIPQFKKVDNAFETLADLKEGIRHRDKRLPNTNDLVAIKKDSMIGLNNHTVATNLGISKETFERWIKEYDEVFDAVEKGRALCRQRAYACFYSQAFPIDETGRPTGKGDPALMIFWMKTRCRWKEPAKDIRLTGNAEAPQIEFIVKQEAKK